MGVFERRGATMRGQPRSSTHYATLNSPNHIGTLAMLTTMVITKIHGRGKSLDSPRSIRFVPVVAVVNLFELVD